MRFCSTQCKMVSSLEINEKIIYQTGVYDYQKILSRLFGIGFTKEVICHCHGDNLSFLLFMRSFLLRASHLERGIELSRARSVDA